ncbi:heparinase II/III domain-containing protein [Paenibacillus sp. TSA_86.1]|uniref:heparinase II/III domain-containing protein n=1 Tax=Paenibacillus sp. TSA_86.1 TaxID=3415649 RepID=UPI0040455BBB
MRTSDDVDEAGKIDWPDEQRIQQVFNHVKKRGYRQGNREFMAGKLRERLSRPALTELLKDLQTDGERALNESLPLLTFQLFRQFGTTGDRQAYEHVYFDRRGRLAAVSLLALDSNAPDMIHALEEILWAVCDEYTWCLPAHLGTGEAEQVEGNIDLFAAETVHMLAEIVEIHRHHLDPLVVTRISLEAERRIFTPLYREKRAYHWQTADHNWSAVCGGCCGMAAMLLLEDTMMLLESTRQALSCMKAFLNGYGEDGGCAEGIGYWVYGFGYFVYYAEMLLDYSEGALNLLTGSKIAAIAAFPLRIHLSGGIFVNYSDSSEHEEIPSGLLSRLAARFGMQVDLPIHIPQLTDDPCRRWAHLLRNVMWSDPAVYERVHEEEAVQANGGFIFQQLEWMVAKGVLHVPNAREEEGRQRSGKEWIQTACSFKGGHNDEPHNHNDLGQVIIHCGGENMLCDPGAGVYTQAYFAPGRERLFHISSAGHNVPMIQGCEQSSGRRAEAKLLEFKLEPDGHGMQAGLDLTRAYPEVKSLQKFTRHVCWRIEKDGAVASLRVIDRFQWRASAEDDSVEFSVEQPYARLRVVERWISRICPVMEKDGQLKWQASRANMYMIYDAIQWQAETEAVHTVDHDQVPVTFYRTSLVWKGNEVTATKGKEERVGDALMSTGVSETQDFLGTLEVLESTDGGDTPGVAGEQAHGIANLDMPGIVCQVDFIIEPHKGETEVSPRE